MSRMRAPPATSVRRLREVDGRRPAHVVRQVGVQTGHELIVAAPAEIGLLQFLQRVHERFGSIGSAVGPEMARVVRLARNRDRIPSINTHFSPR